MFVVSPFLHDVPPPNSILLHNEQNLLSVSLSLCGHLGYQLKLPCLCLLEPLNLQTILVIVPDLPPPWLAEAGKERWPPLEPPHPLCFPMDVNAIWDTILPPTCSVKLGFRRDDLHKM